MGKKEYDYEWEYQAERASKGKIIIWVVVIIACLLVFFFFPDKARPEEKLFFQDWDLAGPDILRHDPEFPGLAQRDYVSPNYVDRIRAVTAIYYQGILIGYCYIDNGRMIYYRRAEDGKYHRLSREKEILVNR